MGRFISLHEMQRTVSAKDKKFVILNPLEEGVKVVMENYDVPEDCARIFVNYVKGKPEAQPKAKVIDRIHTRYDADGNKLPPVPEPRPEAGAEAEAETGG